ncbi:MAG: DUF2786 domain-containing protein [Acidimicrobiales bacterium]|jgi:hypothetical protein
MGTKNRERRRQKQAKHNRARRGGASRGDSRSAGRNTTRGSAYEFADELLDALITDAIYNAAHADCQTGFVPDATINALVEGFGVPGGPETVQEKIFSSIVTSATRSLRGGWEPEELERVLRRKATVSAARLCVNAIATAASNCWGAETQDDWERQIAAMKPNARPLDPGFSSWPSDVDAALRALGVLDHLPPMPNLGALPRTRPTKHSDADEQVLARVRALLAKAESTDFPEEADALTAKAQQLMTRHCLDRSLVDAQAGHDAHPHLQVRRCWLDDPYLEAKGLLLTIVASANRCRTVLSPDVGFSTIVGHPDDIDASELLFTSLLVQATRRMTVAADDPTHSTRSRRPSYRRSFLVAYAHRIGMRLDEVSQAATAEADKEHGGALLPVLARRSDHIDEAVDALFGELTSSAISVSDYAGWAAGTAAADLADLVTAEQLAASAVA